MSVKEKTQAKQDARAEKQTDDILSGMVKVGHYKDKKRPSQPNRKGGSAPSEEKRNELASKYIRLLNMILPGILVKFKDIPDPRRTRRVRYTLPMLMLFGIIMFLNHSASRRAANREIADDRLLSLADELIPGMMAMPHADTLARILAGINADNIEEHYAECLQLYIKSKEFRELNPGRLVVACDGTQKFARAYEWDSRALNQNVGAEGKERHYVYLLESVLIMENGMVLPLLTEFLENEDCGGQAPGASSGMSTEAFKQDCETKAFYRLTERLVKLLGKGVVTMLLDGIYACGPIVSLCNQYGWEFMITLKRSCLTTVWDDFNGLRKIESDNALATAAGSRNQLYQWSNGIEYIYGANRKKLMLNVVTCEETWTEAHPRSGGIPEEKITEYAWLSSRPINIKNVERLCSLGRSRWYIEIGFLVEKHNGYNYSHCYSYDWNTMKGFHVLMKYGIFINTLLMRSQSLCDFVIPCGNMGFIMKVWEVLRKCDCHEFLKPDRQSAINRRQQHRIAFPALSS